MVKLFFAFWTFRSDRRLGDPIEQFFFPNYWT